MTNKLTIFSTIALVFLLYANSISNKYSLDDHLVNYRNPLVSEGIKGIPGIFSNLSFNEKDISYAYRPVLLSTFAIEFSLFGINPHLSHFFNICVYTFTVLLLFQLLKSLFPENFLLSFIAVLLFAAHPIHSEMVNNIKSRDELLNAIFGLAILIQYLKYLKDNHHLRLISISFLFCFGLLTKPTIFLYVAILPFLYFIINPSLKNNWKAAGIAMLTLSITFVGFLMLKNSLVSTPISGRPYNFYENPLVNASLWERIPAALSLCLFNLKILCWPFVLSFYYGFNAVPVHSWSNILPYFGLAFHLSLIIVAIGYSYRNKFLMMALLFYLINIAFVSNLFVLIPGIIAERFLLLASAAQCMLLSYFIVLCFHKLKWIDVKSGNPRFTYKPIIILLLVLTPFGAKVFSRNKAWADEYTLISMDAANIGNSAKIHDMMAYQLFSKTKTEQNKSKKDALTQEAINHCRQCIEIYNDHLTCWNNLGTIYFSQQNFNEAETCFKRALEIDSADVNPLFNLANIHNIKNNTDEAINYYEKALKKNPDIQDLIPLYKQFIVKNNRITQAINFVKLLTDNDFKNNYNLHLLMIDFYNESKDFNNVLVYLKKAYSIKPTEEIEQYIDNFSKIAN